MKEKLLIWDIKIIKGKEKIAWTDRRGKLVWLDIPARTY